MSQQDASNGQASYKLMCQATIDQIRVHSNTASGQATNTQPPHLSFTKGKTSDGTSIPSDLPASIALVADQSVPKNDIVLMMNGKEVGRIINVG